MKIYSNVFDLARPVSRQIYVAPNSVYAFGIKIVNAGVPETDFQLKVFLNGVEIDPMGSNVDGFKLYRRTSPSAPTSIAYDVVYIKGTKVQHFDLVDNTTNSTVFDIDQEGGALDLPIASLAVLGGVKVGKNLTIEADGTLNVKGTVEETDPVFVEKCLSANSIILGHSAKGNEAGNDSVVVIGSIADGSGSERGVFIGNGAKGGYTDKPDALMSGAPFAAVCVGTTSYVKGPGNVSIGAGANCDGTKDIAIGFMANSNANNSIAIGDGTNCTGLSAVVIGTGAKVNGNFSIAIGNSTQANNDRTIQLGSGSNNTYGTFQVWDHTLLNKETGLIPPERLGTGYDSSQRQVLVNNLGTLVWETYNG